jgi:hypothetical protein
MPCLWPSCLSQPDRPKDARKPVTLPSCLQRRPPPKDERAGPAFRRAVVFLRDARPGTSTQELRQNVAWLGSFFQELAALRDDQFRDKISEVSQELSADTAGVPQNAVSGGPDEPEDIFYDAPAFSDADAPHNVAEACAPAACARQTSWPHWAESERSKAVHALIPQLRQVMPVEWQVRSSRSQLMSNALRHSQSMLAFVHRSACIRRALL